MNGSGQSILALAAFAVLSLLTLNANRLIISSFQSQMVSKQSVAAIAVGNSFLEEIQSKAFDEAVAANPLGGKLNQNQGRDTSAFTLPKNLGPETGEKYPFDDIDDYNGYKCAAWNPLFADSLDLSALVFYVKADKPSDSSIVKTTVKKVTVKVRFNKIPNSKDKWADSLAIQQLVYQ